MSSSVPVGGNLEKTGENPPRPSHPHMDTQVAPRIQSHCVDSVPNSGLATINLNFSQNIFVVLIFSLQPTYFILKIFHEIKKQQSSIAVRNDKKSPWQETGLGNRGRPNVLNDTELVLNQDQFGIIENIQHSLLPKPVSCPGLFLPYLTTRLFQQRCYSFLVLHYN